ncbi:hypothetical protein [Silvanigrella aquatica]|uniref:Uncharacterized protein n=1 Tax=Silvanigrella aquatica TaxID=1915309 RepID=A0A1L4D300_9BACT|nr:hypothetical protein [Silvanigrella aquatica]APJ04585.1 hypothetical protein AXG55_11980 [Silvanigrella aquatica]
MIKIFKFLELAKIDSEDKDDESYDLKDFFSFITKYMKIWISSLIFGLGIGLAFSLNKTKFYNSIIPIEISDLSYNQTYKMKENILKSTSYHFGFLLDSDLFYQEIFNNLFKLRPEFKDNLLKYNIDTEKLNKTSSRLIEINSDKLLTFLYIDTKFPFIIKDKKFYDDLLTSINYAAKLFNEAQLKNYSKYYEKNNLEIKNFTKKNKIIFDTIYEYNILLTNILLETNEKTSKSQILDSNYKSISDESNIKNIDNYLNKIRVKIYSNLAMLKYKNKISDSDNSAYLSKISDITADFERLNLELSANHNEIKTIYDEINSYFINPKNFYLPSLNIIKNPDLKEISVSLIPTNHFVFIGSGAIIGFLFGIIISFIYSIIYCKNINK